MSNQILPEEKKEIFVKLKKIIVQELSVKTDEIKLKSNFIEDLGADSLDMVELVLAIEESFDIEVPDQEVASIQNVHQAINLIQKICNNSK